MKKLFVLALTILSMSSFAGLLECSNGPYLAVFDGEETLTDHDLLSIHKIVENNCSGQLYSEDRFGVSVTEVLLVNRETKVDVHYESDDGISFGLCTRYVVHRQDGKSYIQEPHACF